VKKFLFICFTIFFAFSAFGQPALRDYLGGIKNDYRVSQAGDDVVLTPINAQYPERFHYIIERAYRGVSDWMAASGQDITKKDSGRLIIEGVGFASFKNLQQYDRESIYHSHLWPLWHYFGK
jgi:hypothetical protein